MIKNIENYDDLIGKSLAYYVPYNSNSMIMEVGTAYEAKVINVVRYLFANNEVKFKLIVDLIDHNKDDGHFTRNLLNQLIDIDDPNLYESFDKLWSEWEPKEKDERERRKRETLRQTIISYIRKIGEQLHDVDIERSYGFTNDELERMIKDLEFISSKLDKIKTCGSKVIDALLIGFDKIKD